MAAQETAISHLTECKVCRKKFLNDPMDVPVLGQPPTERVAKFVGELAGHLNKKHPDKWQSIQVGGQEFMGMLIMMLYSTTDPNLLATIAHVRGMVAMLCRDEAEIPTDATIIDRVARVGLDAHQQDLVVQMMRELRDRAYKLGAFGPSIIVAGN